LLKRRNKRRGEKKKEKALIQEKRAKAENAEIRGNGEIPFTLGYLFYDGGCLNSLDINVVMM